MKNVHIRNILWALLAASAVYCLAHRADALTVANVTILTGAVVYLAYR